MIQFLYTCIYIKVMWSVLSLAISPTPILHSYISSLPILLMAAMLLYLLDVCIYHVRNHGHVTVFSICYTSHYKDYNINSCYPKSETLLPLSRISALAGVECRSHDYHTAFMVGQFYFQHPCMFLFRLLDKSTSLKSS